MRSFKLFSAIVILATSLVGAPQAFAADEKLKPLNKLKPTYPRRALQRGIEGYVQLTYNVDDAGAVKDIQITDAKPAKIFDKAAKKAIKKLKYPKGKATAGVTKKIQFKLG